MIPSALLTLLSPETIASVDHYRSLRARYDAGHEDLAVILAQRAIAMAALGDDLELAYLLRTGTYAGFVGYRLRILMDYASTPQEMLILQETPMTRDSATALHMVVQTAEDTYQALTVCGYACLVLGHFPTLTDAQASHGFQEPGTWHVAPAAAFWYRTIAVGA